jgi:hypothetical protein
MKGATMATRHYSREAIQTAAHYLKLHNGNTAQAAHDCDVERISIAPYHDKTLDAAYDILRRFSADKIERAAKHGTSDTYAS